MLAARSHTKGKTGRELEKCSWWDWTSCMIASFLKCKEFTYFLSNSLSDLLSGSTLLKREISLKKKKERNFRLPLCGIMKILFFITILSQVVGPKQVDQIWSLGFHTTNRTVLTQSGYRVLVTSNVSKTWGGSSSSSSSLTWHPNVQLSFWDIEVTAF